MFETYPQSLGSMSAHFSVPPSHGRPPISNPIIMTANEVKHDLAVSTARTEISKRHRLPSPKKNYTPLILIGGVVLFFGIRKGSKKKRAR